MQKNTAYLEKQLPDKTQSYHRRSLEYYSILAKIRATVESLFSPNNYESTRYPIEYIPFLANGVYQMSALVMTEKAERPSFLACP